MSKDIGQNENTPDLFGHVALQDEPSCLGEAKPPGKPVDDEVPPEQLEVGAEIAAFAQMDERHLPVKVVAERFSVSGQPIWRWLKENSRFPKPYRISRGCTRWRLSEIVAYELELRTHEQDGPDPSRGRGK